ncbi:uncharacterized protein LOC143842940 [Paroedura picta]|uniref:uncharacterized protein LOC143842940 n=1 Tax=Paroedura picta TaxID=143630 RepID=UPI0040569B88
MNEDRSVSGTDPAEKGAAMDEEQHPNPCFQASALCCCIPRRRISLPGRRPKERKKKKNAGGLSFSDIMFEEEMDQACWNIPAGDQDSVQTQVIKSILPLCPEAYDTKDHSVLLPIGTFCLEEKQKDYDEKPVVKSLYKKGKATRPSKEGLDDWSVLSSEMENKSTVGAVSGGLPFKKGTSYQVIPDKGNSQAGRPESLGTSFQEVAHENEQQEGGDHASIRSEGVACKMACEKQEQQAVPLQELQPSGKSEDLESSLPETKIKMQEEQNNTSTDYEVVQPLTELLIQPWIPNSEEQQSLERQELAKDVAHKIEEHLTWDKMNTVPKEDIHKKIQGSPDTLNQEVWQPVELKYPESLSILDTNHEQEQSEMLYHEDPISEASHSETEHSFRRTVDHDVQWPTTQKAISYSFQDIAFEKEQEGSANFISDSPLSKAGEHQWSPHQMSNKAVVQENKTTFPLIVSCATEQQKLDHMNNMLEDGLVYLIPQKNQEKQHIFLAEHVSSTHHHRLSHEKELREGLDYSYSGSQAIAFTGEKENPGLLIPENMGTLPDNISYEKEQQRKLECGDSGPESLFDKEEQDCQPALYLGGQLPLALEHLSSGSLDGTPEAEQCTRKSGTLEMLPLEEQQVECGDQSMKLLSGPSKDKEAKDDQEEKETTMFPSAGKNTQREQMEAWHTPEDTFISHKEQLQREQIDLNMTCEEHQRKGLQGLSETSSSVSSTSNEDNM